MNEPTEKKERKMSEKLYHKKVVNISSEESGLGIDVDVMVWELTDKAVDLLELNQSPKFQKSSDVRNFIAERRKEILPKKNKVYKRRIARKITTISGRLDSLGKDISDNGDTEDAVEHLIYIEAAKNELEHLLNNVNK